MYQKLNLIIPDIKAIKRVCISKINPIDKGVLIIKNIILFIKIKIIKIFKKISENSLKKILILEIKDINFLFFWCYKNNFIFNLQD